MHLNKKSKDFFRKTAYKSGLFKVSVLKDEVVVEEKLEGEVKGDVLYFSEDFESVFDIALQYRDTIDYLFYYDGKNDELKVIAEADKNSNLSVKEIFRKIRENERGFEDREFQVDAAQSIEKSLKNNKNLIIEAATGIGKSLAYLVPAAIFSITENKKVVISTNTINLQRQLIEKDLPVIKKFIDIKVNLALGRANYLCRRKAKKLFDKGDLFLFESGGYRYLKQFLEHTETGLKSEYFDSKKNMSYESWDSVSSSSKTCIHSKCPYYRNRCFYYKARQKLESSNLIIANHHIVFSDALIKDAKVLPKYDAIIFDEAHNIEKNATNYFTETVSISEILNTLDRLYLRKKTKEKGYLSDIDTLDVKNLKDLIENSKKELKQIYKNTAVKIFNKSEEINMDENNRGEVNLVVNEIIDILEKIYTNLKLLKNKVDENEFLEIASIADFLNEKKSVLDKFIQSSSNENIVWLKKTQNSIHFNITPINIAESLKSKIYQDTDCSIFTSATISTNNKFDFFKRSVGIEDAEEKIYKSNFDYKKLSKIAVVKDCSDPKFPSYTKDVCECVNLLAGSIENLNRGVLVLFTSYRMLNEVYSNTYEQIEKEGFETLKQGDFDNFELLRTFKENRSFLFATSSFWEGVDIKGNFLSIVFITKLPFEVPNTPIEKTRYELMKKEGINSFTEYSLPKAVLKFRQGFGRLIRSKNDNGMVIVSDSRIVKKSYGKAFLNSLPDMKKEVIKKNEIQDSVYGFFSNFD